MCGIFTVTGIDNAARIAINGLKALQGRGHQSAGGGVFLNGRIRVCKEKGAIENLERKFAKKPIPGRIASFHTRYATAGANLLKNTHPFVSKDRRIAVVHNGEIVNADNLRSELMRQGVKFESTSDSEVILRLLENSPGKGIIQRVMSVLNRLERAFALVIIWDGYMIGAVDCKATHPLWLGRIEINGDVGHCFASEDSAIMSIEGTPIKEVQPGRVIVISPNQDRQTFWLKGERKKTCSCSFNLVYTARPDTCIWGRSVSKAREALGHETFQEMTQAGILPYIDVIVPVLDSGRTATLAFAKQYALWRIRDLIKREGPEILEQADLDFLMPYNHGINRAHSTRSFQIDTQEMRAAFQLLKHGIDPSIIRGKRVLVGDDSIVRATTSQRIISNLRKYGATEVHFVSFSPSVIAPCPYGGTETKDQSLLTARGRTVEKVCEIINADSLYYLSLAGFRKVLSMYGRGYCVGCMSDEF